MPAGTAGIAAIMVESSFYRTIGYAHALLAQSAVHQDIALEPYFASHILPPILHRQIKIYLSANRRPSAMVTWAWISPETLRRLLADPRPLERQEWTGGDALFFNLAVTLDGSLGPVIRDLSQTVFADQDEVYLYRTKTGPITRIRRRFSTKVG